MSLYRRPLEKYGQGCTFALIVLTADDETTSGGARARQNVIHELSFFHGILGRDKVLLLKEDGADVLIDGLFIGNAPANLTLEAGVHIIEVQKTGYQPFRREVRVLPDSDATIMNSPTICRSPSRPRKSMNTSSSCGTPSR